MPPPAPSTAPARSLPRLFVTRKTVEKHLGSAYSTLDISRRDDIAGVLGADRDDDRVPRPTT
jgi:hypothetical protein